MVEEASFLSLVGLLNEVFEDLVLELSDKGLVDLEVDEAMAEVRLKAIRHLDEVSRLCQLLLLNLQYSLQEFIIGSASRHCLRVIHCLLVCFILERRHLR